MTRDELTALSGPELDALIAEKVMGWAVARDARGAPYSYGSGHDAVYAEAFQPSADIAAAVQVAEKAGLLAWHLSKYRGEYRCQIVQAADLNRCFEARADTAALAVCRAALLAALARPGGDA